MQDDAMPLDQAIANARNARKDPTPAGWYYIAPDTEVVHAIGVMLARDYFNAGDDESYKKLARWYAGYRQGRKVRGLFFYGKTGRGKTHFLDRIVKPHLSASDYSWFDAKELQAHASKHGAEPCLELCRRGLPDSDWPHSEDIVIDDIMSEDAARNYGNTTDIIADMICELYPRWQKFGFCLFLTANEVPKPRLMGPEEALNWRYGSRVASRVLEMCEIIELNGRDMRL